MSLAALFFTLLFIASVLLLFGGLVSLGVLALTRRWTALRSTARFLGLYVAAYGVALVAVALSMPRRFMPVGARECFDDWCVAGHSAAPAPASLNSEDCAHTPDQRVWLATIDLSSDAKRVRQRAWDAAAQLEDSAGRRYSPCGPPTGAHTLTEVLDPGQRVQVVQPFVLPAGAVPVGIVVHHGAFPGIVTIGDDQSLLHPPTLLGVQLVGGA